ncbi:uncharacterized protein LOC106081509 [Stomoxys calcitrans]|uniref:uncharacterized protein LOC106081509 n=1 Tax=Stomoxys calcitrans TaxID=35570 RepID=UPI0027E337B2|nr:uncharacterized protein LOC106081509 [Stomoxys calcitrans]
MRKIKVYVGRAKHFYDLIPASVYESKVYAIVPWGGAAHEETKYEVLAGLDYGWEACQDGKVPQNAVKAGKTNNGEWLYVGRAEYEGTRMVGKIQPSEKSIYIPYKQLEIKLKNYEALYYKDSDTWKTMSMNMKTNIFPDAVEVGEDRDYSKMYVARGMYQDMWYPVKCIPDREEAFLCYDGPEQKYDTVQFLVGDKYYWKKPTAEDDFFDAVFTDHTKEGEPLFVGRGYHEDVICTGLVSLVQNILIAPYGAEVKYIKNFEILMRK